MKAYLGKWKKKRIRPYFLVCRSVWPDSLLNVKWNVFSYLLFARHFCFRCYLISCGFLRSSSGSRIRSDQVRFVGIFGYCHETLNTDDTYNDCNNNGKTGVVIDCNYCQRYWFIIHQLTWKCQWFVLRSIHRQISVMLNFACFH